MIFDEVKALYEARKEALTGIVAERRAEEKAWADANPEKAAELTLWFENKAPQIDWSKVVQKENDATRNASGAVLAELAKQVPNMVCSSADLSESDKTISFLKQTHSFQKGDFSGAFFQAGVAELTMACCCIGMALHGGVIAACATFFVFSDYMKPAVRMAALMELPVKFIWTHDAFRVGEDGPTHEPVEQEAQIRLMEKLKNHHGRNSVLVLRPADAEETTVAWKLAMENVYTPTALILSRQNINNLPAGNDYSLAEKGGYIVAGSDENPDVVLVATGSEVSTLVEGAKKLREDGGADTQPGHRLDVAGVVEGNFGVATAGGMEVADVVGFVADAFLSEGEERLWHDGIDFGTGTYCDGVVSAERTEADREDILADVGSDAILVVEFRHGLGHAHLGVGEEGQIGRAHV